MAVMFLNDEALPDFLNALRTYGELHGPVLNDDDVPIFAPLHDLLALRLDLIRTQIPPKKYLLPFRETLLHVAPGAGYQLPAAPPQRVILFGLHTCDLQAIAYLDRIFLEPEPDPWYLHHRQAMTLVGLSCVPDEFCFCGDQTENGRADLFLQQTTGGFEVSLGTGRGRELAEQLAGMLTERDRPPPQTSSPRFPLRARLEDTCRHGETFPEHPLWEQFAKRCLSCGACSVCCPTCYCFDVRESFHLTGNTARLREWDNCLFQSHGQVAGGGNFRRSRQERLHYRYQHKYLGFGPLRGRVSCVGCGRCRAVCPVGIDLTELFREDDDERC